MHRLPEAWIAPPPTRELRELVRYRAKLVALRSGLKAQVHSVLAKAGVLIPVSDLFGVDGPRASDAGAARRRVRAAGDLAARADRRPRRARGTILRPDRHRVAWRIRGYPGDPGSCPGSVPPWRRCSSRRSGTCTGSPTPPPVFVGRSDPQAPRVRHRRSPRAHHEAGLQTGALGGGGGHPAATGRHEDLGRPHNASRPAAAGTSPRSPRPANCSPSSTTGCATGTSARWPTRRRRREHPGRNTRAAAVRSDPRTAWSPT